MHLAVTGYKDGMGNYIGVKNVGLHVGISIDNKLAEIIWLVCG